MTPNVVKHLPQGFLSQRRAALRHPKSAGRQKLRENPGRLLQLRAHLYAPLPPAALPQLPVQDVPSLPALASSCPQSLECPEDHRHCFGQWPSPGQHQCQHFGKIHSWHQGGKAGVRPQHRAPVVMGSQEPSPKASGFDLQVEIQRPLSCLS